MLQCLVETCRLIDSDASAMSGAPISADELMPLATYVMLRAQVGLTARDRVGFRPELSRNPKLSLSQS